LTLLDTGVWFRYFHRLPLRSGLEAYIRERPPLFLSAISIWEIATKQRLGRLPCPPLSQWLNDALADYEVVPISDRIAQSAGEDPMANQDPADRLIVATARVMDLTLLHTDSRIREVTGVKQRYFKGVEK
jgi:PIN domain nuclease of toxin-antitoxin system